MATVKVTFTFDEATISLLNQTAERLAKSKSEVVREAIYSYHERIGRLSERERRYLLAVFDRLVPKIPVRPEAEVDRELNAIRRARRGGGLRLWKG